MAYQRTCRSPGTQTFQLFPALLSVRTTQIKLEATDLSEVPPEYHRFADVFDKQRSRILSDHRPYDLTIRMDKDAIPPLGPIYSLSTLELQTLREFVEENIKTGAI